MNNYVLTHNRVYKSCLFPNVENNVHYKTLSSCNNELIVNSGFICGDPFRSLYYTEDVFVLFILLFSIEPR